MDSKFITAKTETGMEIKSDSEAFTTGVEVYTEVDGKKTPCADGEYKLESGETLKVAGGKVTEVVPSEEMEAEEVIQSAMKPHLEAIRAEMKSQKEAYEAKIKELETKLSNLPAQVKQEKPEPVKKLTQKQALEIKLGILRKKSQETEKNTKK